VNKKILQSIFILCFSFISILGSQIDFNLPISEIELKVQQFIQEHKLSSEKTFYLYSLAARNLKKRNMNEFAQKYYRLALKEPMNSIEQKIEIYSELIYLLEEEKKYEQIKNEITKLESMVKHSKYLDSYPDYAFVIDYFKVIANQDTVQNSINKDYRYFEESIFYSLVVDYEFEMRMKKGMFAEAYEMFQSYNQNISQIELRSAHDLLAIILKRNPKKWYCDDTLKEFPNEKSFSVKICKALHEKKSNQITSINIQELLITQDHYLIPAIKAVF